MYPVGFCSELPWCIVYDVFCINSVEVILDGHEITDVFAEVDDFNLGVVE